MAEIKETRKEILLNAIANGTQPKMDLKTRVEMFLGAILGIYPIKDLPDPKTREEILLNEIIKNGGASPEYVNGNEVSY